MRWLFLKDLRILRRSPLLVGVLALYPVVIAVLIGLALSRGPERPRVAVLSLVPSSADTFLIAGERVDPATYASRLYASLDPVRVATRAQAIARVRSGDALAALIVPRDITRKLSTGGLQRPTVEVVYNVEDPVKARFVESTIKARLADANLALSNQYTKIANGYLRLLLGGGSFTLFGRQLDVLGLRNARAIVRAAIARLPPASADRRALEQVSGFATLAIDNLGLSNRVLTSVGAPIAVRRTVLEGSPTPLNEFAVAVAVTISLMFVTVLLGAGMLALEREEHAFSRLARGLVPRLALVAEKVVLAAACALVLSLGMLAGLGAFVSLDWARFPLWVLALAVGAVAFGALGVAIGGLAREVRAASLIGVLIALPIAFLALVPSGAVSVGVYGLVRAISAVFPFDPALRAVRAALEPDSGDLAAALAHLAALTVAFAAVGRLALRRFA